MKKLLTILVLLAACTKPQLDQPVQKTCTVPPELCAFPLEPVAHKREGFKKPEPLPSVILLDFDGQVITGNSWNGTSGSPVINCLPAELDGPTRLLVFDSVKAKYAEFPVIVTTDEAVYNSGAPGRRMRCIITPSYEWFSSQYGGTSYMGSFHWGDNTPCFVFASLLNNNAKKVWEAAAHEVGHTLGLRHQSLWDINCSLISLYSDGGAYPWAPIMGISYTKPGIWWRGTSEMGCSEMQDDRSIINQSLYIPRR